MTIPASNSSNTGLPLTTDIATAQNTCDLQTPGATCYNRSVECVEPSVSIKLDSSQKRDITYTGLHESGLNKRMVLKYIPFKIDDTVFNYINGNERDDELAKKMIDISDDWPKSSFSFNIKTQDGSHDYKPPHLWQERLLRCINVGLQSLFDDCPPERIPVLRNKTVGEIYQGRKVRPTCFQFVSFMEFNSNSFRDGSTIELTNLEHSDKKKQFTPLAILKDNIIIHVFIHIGDNICIGKMEDRNIFFHTTEDILSHYQVLFENPLSLAIADIKPLQ